MKTIRNFQPWAALFLLLCGSLSGFGQAAPNFNVTVTETTASGCGECEPMQLESQIIINTNPHEPNTIIDPCLNSGTGFLSIIPTSFDVNLDLSELELEEDMSVTYQVSAKVYYPDDNASSGYTSIQVRDNANPPSLGIGSMFSYISYGTTATLSPEDENPILTFHIDIDLIDPGVNTNNFFFFEFIFTEGIITQNGFQPFVHGKRYSPYLKVPRCIIGPNNNRDGLENPFSEGSINLYPNPSTNSNVIVEAQIPTIGNLTPKAAQVDLYNLQGQRIMSLENSLLDSTGKLSQKINIEHLAKGVYFLEVSSGSYHASSKLIKQ